MVFAANAGRLLFRYEEDDEVDRVDEVDTESELDISGLERASSKAL